MASSDRSDGNATGKRAPARIEPEPEVERSERGRIIIRSSSHPPAGERGSETPLAEPRSKRDTPAERPSRRRKRAPAQVLEPSPQAAPLPARAEPAERRVRPRWIAPLALAVLAAAGRLLRRWFGR